MLGYPDIIAAADAVPDVLAGCATSPLQIEALDHRLLEIMEHLGCTGTRFVLLPGGLVQFGADTVDECDALANGVLDALGKSADDVDVTLTDDPGDAAVPRAGAPGGRTVHRVHRHRVAPDRGAHGGQMTMS